MRALVLLVLTLVARAAFAEPDALTKQWFNGDVLVQVGNGDHDTPWPVTPHSKKEVAETSKALFGHALSVHEYAALVGAPDGTKLVVTIGQPDRLVLFLENEKLGLVAERWVLHDADGPYLWNQEVHLAANAPDGMGTRILAHQVAGARKLGVRSIETSAARTPSMNGYYTWPRLGFDGEVPKMEVPVKLGHPHRLSEVMSTTTGRAWWKTNGATVQMSLSLASDASLHDHRAYLAEKHVSIPDDGLLAHPHAVAKTTWSALAHATRQALRH